MKEVKRGRPWSPAPATVAEEEMAAPALDFIPPVRREDGARAPDYEFWPRKFSTVVMYGGFFCGSGKNKGYIEGARAIYDHCDADNWSEAAVHFIQADLGYVDTSACNVYWLEDGQGLANGLRVMKWEEDAQKTADFQKMAAVAGSGMTLRLYVDSVNFHASEEEVCHIGCGVKESLPHLSNQSQKSIRISRSTFPRMRLPKMKMRT